LTVNVAANAPSSVTNSLTVSGGGEVIPGDDTGTDVTQIGPAVALTVTNEGNPVTAGHSTTFAFSITSFTQNPVTLSCTGLPALAACNFSPSSITGQGNTTLTITTTSPTLSAALPTPAAPFYAMLLPLLGLLVTRLSKRRCGKGKGKLTVSATLLALLFLAGCGGGSSGPAPTLHGGTPAGNYTVTVIATDSIASLQGSTTVSLSVNWSGL
jgi:hypothetical protein